MTQLESITGIALVVSAAGSLVAAIASVVAAWKARDAHKVIKEKLK